MLSKSTNINSGFRNFKTIQRVVGKRNRSTVANIVYPRVPDLKLSRCLLHEYVWNNLDKWHDKTALVCAETDRLFTYGELHRKSRSLGTFLRKHKKLKLFDTVAVYLPNVPEYAIIVLGATQYGLKVTTINPAYTADEIKRQLVDSEAKIIFTLGDLYPQIHNAIQLVKKDIPIVVIKDKPNSILPEKALKFEEISEIPYEDNKDGINPDDTACLPYSSGTTGLPKGVQLSHQNIVANLQQMASPEFKLNINTEGFQQDVVPLILPMYHIYGLSVILLNMLSEGCKMVTVPKFSTNVFVKLLERHKPHILYAVPPIVLMLLNSEHIKVKHLESIRQIVCSASPLGAADIERFHEKTSGKKKFMQIYGMTETSPLVLHQSNLLSNGVKVGASGLLMPNTVAKIVSVDDASNKPLEKFQSGELLVKGPQVMKGYHNNPEATSSTIIDDWMRTGDIAHYDEDGQFYITDRLKELIKVKGFQVAPAELEELLRSHPAISDAAVIGVKHTSFGEVPKAFVVLKSDFRCTSDDIKEYLANKVAPYKRLAGGLKILNNIPRTPSGKILRRQLKEL